jgi:hypothetical protein
MSVWPDFPIKDFSAGMLDKIDDNILPTNAARDCRNFICKTLGILDKRNGQARLNGTALAGTPHGLYAYYNDESIKKLLVVAGTALSVWNPSTSAFDSLRTGLDASAQMIFETCANYVVGMNGVSSPWKWSGTGATSVLANAPATGRYPVLYKEKLFCVPGDNLSQVWWSESFAPESWPAINYWGVKEGDGDTIRCLKVFLGDLIIFKARSTHLLRGTNISDFRLDEMDSQIGCVGPLAAAPLGGRLYFVSEEGLYYFSGVGNVSISANAIPLLWGDINKKYLDKACVYTWNDLVWFSLPLNNQLTLKVTAGCTAAGSITIKLGGVEKTVALTLTDDTVNEVVAKIGALTFDGWTLTVNNDTVTFTRDELRQPLELELQAGTTGATGTVTAIEQATNNLVIMYDPVNGGKFWPMDDINASCFVAFNDGTNLYLYSGDSLAGYVNQQDIGTEDFGSPVSAYWVGTGFDMKEADHLKKAKKAFIEDYPDQITPATLKISLDYGEFHEWTLKHNDEMIREYRIPSEYKKWWRYLTPRFSHTSAGKCQIRGLTIPFKAKKKPKGRTLA